MTALQPDASRSGLRIAFVPGVTVGKWTRRWQERHPDIPLEVLPVEENEGLPALLDGRATMSFVRLPVDREGLGVIRLYGELGVLAVCRDSELAVLESVTMAQIGELSNVVQYPTIGRIADAVALIAAGGGAMTLPHSVARLHARKDVVAIPIADAPETEVAIVWLTSDRPELSYASEPSGNSEPPGNRELIEQFIGIVRGRTAASSRGNQTPRKRRGS